MKIKLLVVGKTSNSHLQSLINDYVKRINHYIKFEITMINNVKLKKINPFDLRKLEGNNILKKINEKDLVFLLDEKGTSYSSIQFSNFIKKNIIIKSKDIIFVIGGAQGFSKELYNRCNSQISFSKMTTSHQLIRLFLAEQLYRAFTILNNNPYHNE
ncbi:MAG: 23S rRNA (pseudouridine(1915)-N(3))-methyltransferase RlmH [Bacteroidetes bacterium]|jgi:23S rRNA (pseudouridine1915-N3)-methyltransferase|nr:23S rRNA (pseudouridine(1915)-N(3))-methyltransferase RlmH [Bacteroidota bacterium]|tara:strand:+ start:13354 stop:13824 length:471 start_codon:yes stop_codon:yes gene_type:complete